MARVQVSHDSQLRPASLRLSSSVFPVEFNVCFPYIHDFNISSAVNSIILLINVYNTIHRSLYLIRISVLDVGSLPLGVFTSFMRDL